VPAACVDGKVSIGSGNHIMHPFTIGGNSRAGYRDTAWIYNMAAVY